MTEATRSPLDDPRIRTLIAELRAQVDDLAARIDRLPAASTGEARTTLAAVVDLFDDLERLPAGEPVDEGSWDGE